MLLVSTPFAILFLFVGIFVLRLSMRIVRPVAYSDDAITYCSLLTNGEICFKTIQYARIWQANYINMSEKNVVIVLPGFLNFYYLLSTKENKLVKTLNMHNIKKRPMLFMSEVHIE